MSVRARSHAAIGLVVFLVTAALVAILPGVGGADPPPGITAVLEHPDGTGALLVGDDGAVHPLDGATAAGSLAGVALSRSIVDGELTPSGQGHWLAGADGGIFAFGDAPYLGSTGDIALNQPIVAMARTPGGQGYWLVASDGGVFSFGDAEFEGSMGGHPMNEPIVGATATASGDGYWLVAADGGIFAFGDAPFLGSTGALDLNQPIVGMAATASGLGYWLIAADGGTFAFGDAPFLGTATSSQAIVDVAPAPGGGYRVADAIGATWTFVPGEVTRSTPAVLNPPVVSDGGAGGGGEPGGDATLVVDGDDVVGLGEFDSVAQAAAWGPKSSDVYASPSGRGSGSINSPASLSAALGGGIRVDPGDTIWLRGGTYRGVFTMRVTGRPDAPIIVRSYPGEWARIDGAGTGAANILTVSGHHVQVRDIEVLDSSTNRQVRPSGIYVAGDYVKVLDCVVHDTANGIASFGEAWATVIAGNIIYNTGTVNPDFGHNLYIANQEGSPKKIEGNVWFGTPTTRFGLHAYASAGGLSSITIRGNVGMENLIGGPAPVDGLLVEDNDFNYLRLGYQWGADRNGTAIVRDNRLGWPAGSTDRPLSVSQDWASVAVTGNTIAGRMDDDVRLVDGGRRSAGSGSWNGNQYFDTTFAAPGFGGDINGWRSATGLDRSSSWSSATPPDHVDVRVSQWANARALVVIENWSGADTVSFDPSSFLPRGRRYRIINAFNPLAGTYATGTWNGGNINVSTTRLTQAAPIGGGYTVPQVTPGVVAFIVKAA